MASEPAESASGRKPSGTPRADPKVLDLAHLGRYCMGDRALEADLLSLFRAQVDLQAKAIAAAEDAESWKFATHTLKGVARTLGAWQVARAAEQLEALGHDGPADQRSRILGELTIAIAECEAAIDGLR